MGEYKASDRQAEEENLDYCKEIIQKNINEYQEKSIDRKSVV